MIKDDASIKDYLNNSEMFYFDKYFENDYFLRCNDYSNKKTPLDSKYLRNNFIENNILQNKKILNFTNENKKILFSLRPSIYHFIINYLGTILRYKKALKDIELIIDISIMPPNYNETFSYINFFWQMLDDLKIKYTIIDINNIYAINIKNFYIIEGSNSIASEINLIYETYKTYIKHKNVEPFRKVYLSRRNMFGHEIIYPEKNLAFFNDSRIDDHEKIEKYFSSIGFEIIIPENFKNFEDQLNYMYETKILISLTGSGLTNCIFMQPEQKIVEIFTPLIISKTKNDLNINFQEEWHFFNHRMSAIKQHKYFSLSNINRSSEEIIKNIEKDELFKQILKK